MCLNSYFHHLCFPLFIIFLNSVQTSDTACCSLEYICFKRKSRLHWRWPQSDEVVSDSAASRHIGADMPEHAACANCAIPYTCCLLNWNTKICRWLVRNLWMLKGVLFSDWFNQPMCTTNTCRGKVLLQKTTSALMGHQVPPC